MACRRIVADKHRAVARLLLAGESGYRALRQCGYPHYSARNFGLILRRSWPLRQAILEEQQRRNEYLIPRPVRVRRDKYARRAVARSVQMFCVPDVQAATTNAPTRYHEEQSRHVRAVAKGRILVPLRCSVCGGPLEGEDRWCVRCERIESGLRR